MLPFLPLLLSASLSSFLHPLPKKTRPLSLSLWTASCLLLLLSPASLSFKPPSLLPFPLYRSALSWNLTSVPLSPNFFPLFLSSAWEHLPQVDLLAGREL